MKLIKFAFILTAVPAIVWSQEQKQEDESGNLLQDVIVEERFEADFEEEKPPLQLEFDFSDVLKIKERVNWNSIDNERPSDSSPSMADLQLSHPDLAAIRPAPVKVFQAELDNISRWELNITASDGSLFRTIRGEGNPPKQIAWDGQADSGDLLIPGASYSFSMTAVDKAGNKGTFPGQSFTVPAYYIETEEKVTIGLAGNMFTSPDRLRLSTDSDKTAQEVASLIRYFIGDNPVSVSGQNGHIDKFVQLVAEELIVDERFFKRTSTQNKEGDFVIFEID